MAIGVAKRVNANDLLKSNIDALLEQRGFKRRDLAQHVQRTTKKKADSWLSKIFTSTTREIPMKYLDRIAGFFGLEPYQLFQPGISRNAERRSGSDRRAGKDRRLSAMNHHVRESVSSLVANLSPGDVADLIRWRALSEESRDAARQTVQELEHADRRDAASRRAPRAAGSRPARAKATGTRGQDRGQDTEAEE